MSKEKKDKHFIKKAYYEGGVRAMREFIKKEMRYPEEALEKGVEGTVHLRYSIDYRGKVTEVKVISGPGYGCEAEAERLVKLLQFKVPKTRKARVSFQKTLQIHFRLPEKKGGQIDQRSQGGMSIRYTYSTTKKEESNEQKKNQQGGGYGYTIRWE